MRTAGFVLLCLLLSASPLMAHAVYWGGSNFNWFHSTYGQAQGECSFPPYGIINNYHLTYQGSAIRSLVQQDLQDMYNQGQRSLSIYLYHSDYALNLGCQPADFPNSRSTIIETHAWSSQDQTNMQDFFNDIQAASVARRVPRRRRAAAVPGRGVRSSRRLITSSIQPFRRSSRRRQRCPW